ncbi:MAG: hypothetical protein CMJ58_10260 [Planctomycetaceae bacterium]|nr:hypothetical protein [Planctomycetaceae bacterium]
MKWQIQTAVVVAACVLTAEIAQAQSSVLTQDFEAEAIGAYGSVSDFSDASYGGAGSAAEIVAGQALEFSFDVKSGAGALNTNVEGTFPSVAMNNSSPSIGDYVLEFDASLTTGTNTGWFGAVEVATPGSGPRTLGFNLGAMTVGGPAVTHSMSLLDMGQPFGDVIDPTQDNWVFRVVALGFPADGGGARTTLRIDNVRVIAVPEPGGLVLAALASTAALAAAVRRRRSAMI